MIWDIVGSTGEWVGAIAVVVTLYYLARQIRLSNLQAQASARYSFHASFVQHVDALLGSGKVTYSMLPEDVYQRNA